MTKPRRSEMIERRDAFTAQDPAFESRVRASFARQTFMATIGARLARVAPGEVDIELDVRDDLVQQHGFLHAGVLASAADSACGYAALSLMPPGAAVLSVEFKVNLLAPAPVSGSSLADGDSRQQDRHGLLGHVTYGSGRHREDDARRSSAR